ncbi:hypothetical protein J6590_065218 [Homalodisca vitripennis]|nr:hypothetical protein J6590_065218 [Homalodisca vitripennis]
MKKSKYPCGVCFKNVSKCAQAVLCKGSCSKWHHFKCIDMSTEDFQKINKLQLEYLCEKCLLSTDNIEKKDENKNKKGCIFDNKNKKEDIVSKSNFLEDKETMDINEEFRSIKIITNEINKELENEVNNLLIIIKTQNEDLNQVNRQVNELRSHNTQLEALVLKKEEEIVLITKKIALLENQLRITNSGHNSRCKESSVGNHRFEIQNLRHYTPTSTPNHIDAAMSELPKTGNVNKELLFSTVVRRRLNKINITPKSTYTEPEISFISPNRFESLNIIESESNKLTGVEIDEEQATTIDTTVTIKKPKKKLLICADSHGKNLSWHVNKKQNLYEAIGFVRPGGRSEQVLNMETINKENLGNEDLCVIIGGTNDVARNEGDKFITGIENVLNEKKSHNFVIVDVPDMIYLTGHV